MLCWSPSMESSKSHNSNNPWRRQYTNGVSDHTQPLRSLDKYVIHNRNSIRPAHLIILLWWMRGPSMAPASNILFPDWWILIRRVQFLSVFDDSVKSQPFEVHNSDYSLSLFDSSSNNMAYISHLNQESRFGYKILPQGQNPNRRSFQVLR